jgi:hypothetical protein
MLIPKESFFIQFPELKIFEFYFRENEILRYYNVRLEDYINFKEIMRVYDFIVENENRNIKIAFTINRVGTFWKVIGYNKIKKRKFEI